MKEPDKNPQEQRNELETGKVPEKEFRVIIVKMIQHRKKNGGTDGELQEMFNKELEGLKNKLKEMSNPITGMKNTLEGEKMAEE